MKKNNPQDKLAVCGSITTKEIFYEKTIFSIELFPFPVDFGFISVGDDIF